MSSGVRRVFIGHGAQDIAFGILEFGEDAHGRDRGPVEDDAAAVLDNGAGYRVEVIDGDRTFEAIGAACAAGFLAFVHEAWHALVPVAAGMDEVEIRRTPGFKAPTKNSLVESAATLDVVGVNGKTG